MSVSATCPGCGFFKKRPGYDFCCRTCSQNNGANCHGSSFAQHIPIDPTNVPPNSTIWFYKVKDPGYWLTNFWLCSVNIFGMIFRNSEAAYQSQKFTDPSIQQCFCNMKPRQAFDAVRSNELKNLVRPDWHSIKDNIMYEVVKAKFVQNPELRRRLLATGASKLIEHTTNDNYWADGGDGSGQNMLGLILMRVRNEMQAGQY